MSRTIFSLLSTCELVVSNVWCLQPFAVELFLHGLTVIGGCCLFTRQRLEGLAACPMASSSLLDSEATFAQQSTEAGLGELWIEALKANSLATFAKLSFAITSPGVVVTDDQINTILGTMRRGVAPSIADLAAFKRVLFESQTLMMHSFKSTARGEDATPRKCRHQSVKLDWSYKSRPLEVLIYRVPLSQRTAFTICAPAW